MTDNNHYNDEWKIPVVSSGLEAVSFLETAITGIRAKADCTTSTNSTVVHVVPERRASDTRPPADLLHIILTHSQSFSWVEIIRTDPRVLDPPLDKREIDFICLLGLKATVGIAYEHKSQFLIPRTIDDQNLSLFAAAEPAWQNPAQLAPVIREFYDRAQGVMKQSDRETIEGILAKAANEPRAAWFELAQKDISLRNEQLGLPPARRGTTQFKMAVLECLVEHLKGQKNPNLLIASFADPQTLELLGRQIGTLPDFRANIVLTPAPPIDSQPGPASGRQPPPSP